MCSLGSVLAQRFSPSSSKSLLLSVLHGSYCSLSLLSDHMKGGPVDCLCLAFHASSSGNHVQHTGILLKFMRIFIRAKTSNIFDYVEMSTFVCLSDI